MFLSDGEIRELTGRQRYHAQRKALAAMRIEFRVRPDGRPMVVRGHVEGTIGQSGRKTPEPDWGAMDAAASAKSR